MSAAGAFEDHFSSRANDYARWRPGYPEALYDAIGEHLPACGSLNVWEAGCGSGQATMDLARRFGPVFASDASREQIALHRAGDNEGARVRLAVEPAEHCSLGDASVHLVAVGQALHWFDQPGFFSECQRVLRPGGVLAAWCYRDMTPPTGMEAAISAFREEIEPWWPPQRIEVERGYADVEWPFAAMESRTLEMQADWTLPHLLGYLSSFSATKRATQSSGEDPVQRHRTALGRGWGEVKRVRRVMWPLNLHLRRKAADADK